MKKTSLLLLILALSVNAVAAPRTKAEAKAIADRLAAKIGTVVCNDAVASRRAPARKAGAEDTEAYYVFDYGDDEGFIIVSGDDRMPEIVGYTDTGAFDEESMPVQLRSFLDAYTRTVTAVAEGDTKAAATARQASGMSTVTPVAPLLGNIRWDQGDPYNLLCPQVNGVQTVTGCTATAMAQIMRYHKFPDYQVAIEGYTTRTHGLAIPAIPASSAEEDRYDWDNMLHVYSSSATELQRNAVAKLMYHVGAALNMDYCLRSEGGSGAYYDSNKTAFKAFGYDQSLLQDVYRRNYSYSDWLGIIMRELNAGRPILYNGQSSGGGHAFVCDGIDSNGLLHVNWGWSGKSNGYYDMTVLNPDDNTGIGASTSTEGYYGNNFMVIGITPHNTSGESQVAEGTYSSDWSKLTMTIAANGASTLYYNSKYTYLNKLTITVTNNSDNEFYAHSQIVNATTGTLPEESDDFPQLYISLQPHEVKSYDMDVTVSSSATQMTYWALENKDYSKAIASATFNVAAIDDPALTITSITSNASTDPSQRHEVTYKEKTPLVYPIKDDHATYNVTITNTGGGYRANGIYFGFYNIATGNFTASPKTVEIPHSTEGVTLSFTDDNPAYGHMAGLAIWAASNISPFITSLNIPYEVPGSEQQLALPNLYLCYAEGPTQQVTITDANHSANDDCYYSTLYLDHAVTIPDGVKAYTAAIKSGTEIRLTEITQGAIPAYTGVILEMAATGVYAFPATTTDITISSDLHGVLESTPTSSVSGTAYVLNIQEGSPIFSQYTGANLGANKAYLVFPSSAKALTFSLDDEVTAIHSVPTPSSGKYYNLQGMEITHPTKGLYIHDGKKVIIK